MIVDLPHAWIVAAALTTLRLPRFGVPSQTAAGAVILIGLDLANWAGLIWGSSARALRELLTGHLAQGGAVV